MESVNKVKTRGKFWGLHLFDEGNNNVDFTLKHSERETRFTEADCSLDSKKEELLKKDSFFKEADCILHNEENKSRTPNKMILSRDGKRYNSCTIFKNKKEMTYLESLQYDLGALKAEYKSECLNNKSIRNKIQSEYKSLMYNGVLAVFLSSSYLLFLSATSGSSNKLINIFITIGVLFTVLRLFVTLLIYMIDCDCTATRWLGRMLCIDPLLIQKADSDLRILTIASEISKLKIESVVLE